MSDNGHPTVAVAESCTGGLLAARIVATPGSGEWFQGGVVAYHASVKHELLGVPAGPVITAAAATAMARGVRDLLGAGLGIATTGVAGPESEEGMPVGCVFVGVADARHARAIPLFLEGEPEQIKAQVVARAMHELERAASGA